MEITLEFAKKMTKPAKGAPGITLRSMNGDAQSCGMILMAASYTDIRSAVGSYRMLTARDLHAVSRGRSLELRAGAAAEERPDAISVLFDFAKELKYNTEDAMDVAEFFHNVMDPECGFGLTPGSIDLSPEALSLKVFADPADPEMLLASLGEICSRYGIGIIK